MNSDIKNTVNIKLGYHRSELNKIGFSAGGTLGFYDSGSIEAFRVNLYGNINYTVMPRLVMQGGLHIASTGVETGSVLPAAVAQGVGLQVGAMYFVTDKLAFELEYGQDSGDIKISGFSTGSKLEVSGVKVGLSYTF